LVKTYVMMIGEFEFEGMFTEHDDPSKNQTENAELAKNIPFPDYSTLLFVVFVLVMSVIIMNLMVGLAVDDIKEIQEHAELEKLSINVRLVLESERFLPHVKCCMSNSFLKNYIKSSQVLSNSPPRLLKMVDVLSKKNIWASLEKRRLNKGHEGDIDKIRENQKDIGIAVKNLTNQVTTLLEENAELKTMILKMYGNKNVSVMNVSRQQSNI